MRAVSVGDERAELVTVARVQHAFNAFLLLQTDHDRTTACCAADDEGDGSSFLGGMHPSLLSLLLLCFFWTLK